MNKIDLIIKNNKKDKEMYTALAIKLLDSCKIRPVNENAIKFQNQTQKLFNDSSYFDAYNNI